MTELPFDISLTRVADGVAVTGRIVRLTREMAQTRIDGRWWTGIGVNRHIRNAENDHSWTWRTEVGALTNNRWSECVAVTTDDNEIQGAMILRLDARSFVDESAGAVNVYAVSTAPRNRGWLVAQPVFQGVGTALIRYAILKSYELGLSGRVVLFAIDEPRTVAFYLRMGFEQVADPDGRFADCMMELTPQTAEAILREAGYEL